MNTIKTFLFFVLTMLIVGCGGGGGGGDSSSGGGSGLSCENNGVPKFAMSADSSAKSGQAFTETYSWCDSDGDITELWGKGTFRGVTVTEKFNAADYRITGTSGTQQNKYNWPATAVGGDFILESWLKDAKGNVSNAVSLKITVSPKETGQFKTYAPGGGIIEKVIQKLR